MPTFQTARLDMVATTVAHLDAELAANDGTAPHQLEALIGAHVPVSWPPGQYDADAMRFFRERLVAGGPSALGWYGWYGIVRAGPHHAASLVAAAGYFGPPANMAVEIGFSVVPERRGEGFATELITALTARALGTVEVDCVVAHTEPANVASQTALLRAGFVLADFSPDAGTLRFERGRA